MIDIRKAFLSGLTGILLTCSAFAQETVTSNMLMRVFAIQNGSNHATAFAIDVDNRQYLVTAKHAMPGTTDTAQIKIFHEEKWKDISVKVMRSDEADIAVLCPPVQIAPALPVLLKGDHYLGQDVFFLGFPYMLHTNLTVPDNRGFVIPFVKKGALSAWFKEGNSRYPTIFVDGINNPGFSGAPIVVMNPKREAIIIGIISGYRQSQDPVTNRGIDTGLISLANSGIIVCGDIKYALDEIKKKPEGAQIQQEKK
ncbi:MAG TPA: hypothetical protein DET40_04810 [Lentisphaeria bacterium]|nr:MAG: hypothetical protein A2X45_13385 [Lentisphaerae bacterium GWF2_50_93]HCE42846.1 hypothetical protein [Lentisphaeria bacterium]